MQLKFCLLVLLAFACVPVISVGQTCGVASVGPGTEMTRIIGRLGLGSDCQRCKTLANKMDLLGPAWVTQNFAEVTSQTIANAENIGHRMGPIRKVGVRMIVRIAVRRTR